MRRGLISWSKEELPESALDQRVGKLQAAMAEAGLDAVGVYTTPARTAGVSWLAGFVPYWNQGLLVVPRQERPILVSALSNRVNGWMRRNAHVADVRNSPRIGAEAGGFVASLSGKGTIGLVDLPHLPAAVVDDISAAGHRISDATTLFAGVRVPWDIWEENLHLTASRFANQALEKVDPAATDAAALVARLDGEIRGAGAEEVYIAVAADLERSKRLIRLEGPAQLGRIFAVRLSVAYKGAWVRFTRTISGDPEFLARIKSAERLYDDMTMGLPKLDRLGKAQSWLIEATRTTVPLEPMAGSMIDEPLPLPLGRTIGTVQVELEIDGTTVLFGGPQYLDAA